MHISDIYDLTIFCYNNLDAYGNVLPFIWWIIGVSDRRKFFCLTGSSFNHTGRGDKVMTECCESDITGDGNEAFNADADIVLTTAVFRTVGCGDSKSKFSFSIFEWHSGSRFESSE